MLVMEGIFVMIVEEFNECLLGVMFLGNIIYGELCVIDLLNDGVMEG